jgi:hypothetical protein
VPPLMVEIDVADLDVLDVVTGYGANNARELRNAVVAHDVAEDHSLQCDSLSGTNAQPQPAAVTGRWLVAAPFA